MGACKGIKKPMSDRAITLMMNKLESLSHDKHEQVQILNQSIMQGWTGLYALKDDGKSRGQPRNVNPNGFANFKQTDHSEQLGQLEKIFDTSEQIKEKYGIRAVRPLAPKTMQRIARGLKKFVLDNPEPFIIQCNHGGERKPQDIRDPMPTITGKHGYGVVEPRLAPYMGTNTTNHPGGNCREPIHTITTGNQQCLISPTLIQYHSETNSDEVRGQGIENPIMTVDSSNRYGLVTSFLSKFYKTGIGQDEREPLHTVTTSAGHFGEVRAFLIKYYGEGTGQDIEQPLDTVTSRDRFGLVTIQGVEYQIVDIGLRMLEPKELYGCQGFPDDYIIDHDNTGRGQDQKQR